MKALLDNPARFMPGGRFFYGSKEEQVAELAAAGVTSNADGPIVKGVSPKGKIKTQPCLTGMVEKVRQREGYESASWRSAGARRLKRACYCRICGGVLCSAQAYCTGNGARAHASCVTHWRRSEVGDGQAGAEEEGPL